MLYYFSYDHFILVHFNNLYKYITLIEMYNKIHMGGVMFVYQFINHIFELDYIHKDIIMYNMITLTIIIGVFTLKQHKQSKQYNKQP